MTDELRERREQKNPGGNAASRKIQPYARAG
jgi:hypothetical protein